MNEDNEMFARLRELKSKLEKLPQDMQVITLIAACIKEAIHKGTRITGIVAHLGYDRRYVGMQLNGGKGTDPTRHYWEKDEKGEYQLLEDSSLQPKQ